jgi:hypothetical protein
MAESIDKRLQDYQERFEELMDSAREGIERQAPEVLDKLATTAKNIAQRLEVMANDARQREAAKAATPEPPETPEPMPPEDSEAASSASPPPRA